MRAVWNIRVYHGGARLLRISGLGLSWWAVEDMVYYDGQFAISGSHHIMVGFWGYQILTSLSWWQLIISGHPGLSWQDLVYHNGQLGLSGSDLSWRAVKNEYQILIYHDGHLRISWWAVWIIRVWSIMMGSRAYQFLIYHDGQLSILGPGLSWWEIGCIRSKACHPCRVRPIKTPLHVYKTWIPILSYPRSISIIVFSHWYEFFATSCPWLWHVKAFDQVLSHCQISSDA